MGFVHVQGRLIDNRPARPGAIGVCRRLHFDTAQGWTALSAAAVPKGLAAVVSPGAAGSFFFLRCFGLSLLFCVAVGQTTAFTLHAIDCAWRGRFLAGAVALCLSLGIALSTGLGALAALLAILGLYNLILAAVQHRSDAVRFVCAELDLAAPGSSLERS